MQADCLLLKRLRKSSHDPHPRIKTLARAWSSNIRTGGSHHRMGGQPSKGGALKLGR